MQVEGRDGNAVDYTLRDISEIEREVLGDEKGLVVRCSRVVETAGNRMVWKKIGVVLITSVVECRCDLDIEREGASNYLEE